MLFEDAVKGGDLSSDSALLYAYGIYLMHGGTPDGFDQLTMDDVQILLMSYSGTQISFMDKLYELFKAMFGGKS